MAKYTIELRDIKNSDIKKVADDNLKGGEKENG